jgi:hypothetical protein
MRTSEQTSRRASSRLIRRVFAPVMAAVAASACAAVVFMAGSGVALAPEAGRLNSNSALSASSGAWAYAVYVESGAPTYGFYLSNAWTANYPHRAYAGYPCSRYAQPGGATLQGYIVVSGSLSRCSEY